ncbi:hypothetical protein QE152_g7965 [Popillia japonica]|uniref:Transmembrane protein 135 n=1 Tax=Popillia japonica TaxID=7064 RepID=A0AAW1MDV4_POPJA
MAVVSKELFYEHITSETPCSVLHLWSSSCMDGISFVAVNVLVGAIKFFGPIYVLRLLLSWKKISPKYLLTHALAYARAVTYGLTFSILFFGGLCVLCNINGFKYYNNPKIAGAVSGLSVLVESQDNKTFNSLIFFNQTVESFVNFLTYSTDKKRSPIGETLVFMLISSTLMYLFKTQPNSIPFLHLWFYPTGSLSEQEPSQANCTHKKSCFEYGYKGAFKFFCVGYVLELIKNMLPRTGRVFSQPKMLSQMLLSRKNVLFGLFFGSYVLLYRHIGCYLRKKDGGEFPIHSVVAGLLAGSTYYLKPNRQIPIIGFTTILQLLWQRILFKYNLPKIPYDLLVFMISNGILMHFRFLLDDYCPKYTLNMLNITTSNLAQHIHDRMSCLMNHTEKEYNIVV